MKYLDEFRDRALAARLAAAIAAAAEPGRSYRFMEFCGGHTHAIFRYGLRDLMPPGVRFVHGPGCPVCVLPIARLDQALAMVEQYDLTLCTYADLMRVPASGRRSLLQAKAAGADIRMLYSTQDALAIARAHPDRQVVFFAIGFETTAPATAVALQQAAAERLANFSLYCNHVLTPPALRAILGHGGADPVAIDGILGPSHVSTILGTRAYRFVPAEYRKPLVIAGFEPLDVMQSVRMLIDQCNAGRCTVENQYIRAVTEAGNRKAQARMAEVFSRRQTFAWRGLGSLPDSALELAGAYAEFDAERRFSVAPTASREPRGCACPSVLRGMCEPPDCPLFGAPCTPENPLGSCMVSSEGACAAYWIYARGRLPAADRETAKQEPA